MDNRSVFQKFDGIRPMAAKVGVPPSTVKSWHVKRSIPRWWHAAILEAAKANHITLLPGELERIGEDAAPTEAAAA